MPAPAACTGALLSAGRPLNNSHQLSGEMDAAMPPLDHETFLRRAFEVAQRARTHGNHPFGAILAGGCRRHPARGRERLYAGPRHDRPCRAASCHSGLEAIRSEIPGGLHALHFGRAVLHVRRRRLLGRHRPHGLWPVRAAAQDHHRQSRREPDARSALPHRLRRRTTAGRSDRAVTGGRSSRAFMPARGIKCSKRGGTVPINVRSAFTPCAAPRSPARPR